MTAKRRNIFRSKAIWLPLMYLSLVIAAIGFVASAYKRQHFGDSTIEEIIFYFSNGLADGQSSSILSAVTDNLLFAFIVLFLLILPVTDFYRNRINIAFDLSFLGRKKTIRCNPSRISSKFKCAYTLTITAISFYMLLGSFGVPAYIRAITQSGTLFEEHFIDPSSVDLRFPSTKRNLIYIYLESMENTVASEAAGGMAQQSVIPDLEKLALDPKNVSFSHAQTGLGGALPATGTTWTVAGMVAQSGGIPLRTTMAGDDGNAMGEYKKFLPGARTLGDILKTQGYNQTFLMGSMANFGGRDKLLTQHGGYTVQDYEYAKSSGMIEPDYGVWWGYEDKKLFQFAREEATRLSRIDAPFNLQLLTADTHFTDGYLDETCQWRFEHQYDQVHACSSRQVTEFVNWVSTQPFANNTTIILTGDHLGMQTDYYNQKIAGRDYRRTIYNAFINPAVRPVNQFSRQFTSFDMFPSTLAAMGVEIPGDQLGLGVNLFSSKPTLVEQLGGIDVVSDELGKRSNLYNQRIAVDSN